MSSNLHHDAVLAQRHSENSCEKSYERKGTWVSHETAKIARVENVKVLPISVPLHSERKRKRPTNTPSQESKKIENEREEKDQPKEGLKWSGTNVVLLGNGGCGKSQFISKVYSSSNGEIDIAEGARKKLKGDVGTNAIREGETVQVNIKGRRCEEKNTTTDKEKCTCIHQGAYHFFLDQERKVERPKLRNAPGARAFEISGSNGVDCDGLFIEQEEMRNGKPCFGRDKPRGGVIYFCKRTKHWKICQDGHPLRENGWNYSQIAEEDSDMPPLGLWTNEKKIQRETKREYADFRVEMVGMNIKG